MAKAEARLEQHSPEHWQYLKGLKQRHILVQALRLLLLVALMGLWELSARLGWIDAFIFSSPSRAVTLLAGMFADGSIWQHLGMTLLETVIGFSLGTLLGLGAAVLLWCSELAQRVSDPYLVILNSLPKIALGPVIIVWVGAGMSSIVVVTLLISIVVTIIGVLNGFMEVDQEKILLLRTFGANRKQIFTRVVFPASLPTIISVLKINVGMSWVGVIVGEFLVSRAGLGYLIVYGGQVFKMDLVMGSVLLLSILAAGMYYLVAIAEAFINKRLGE